MEEINDSQESVEEVSTSETTDDVVETAEAEDTTDSKTPTLEDYYELEKKNKELFERAKKAEIAAKQLKAKPAEVTQSNQNDTTIRDELILIAKGERPEVVDEAKLIAKAKGIPLSEALEYPTIKSFKEAIIAKEKSEKAQLSASGSSSSSSQTNPYEIAGEAPEDHQKRFEAELKKRGLK